MQSSCSVYGWRQQCLCFGKNEISEHCEISLSLCENLNMLGSHSPTSTWKNRMAAGWQRNETKVMYCDMDIHYVSYIGLDESFQFSIALLAESLKAALNVEIW